MATPKYRFIPLAYMQEVAERLSSETPVQTPSSKDIYRYRLRELSEEVRQLVLKEVANDIKNWAEAEEKVITDLEDPLTKPRFLRLKANTDNANTDNPCLWTDEGCTSLLVPFFDRTIQVLVRAQGSDEEARIDWERGSILHLDERMGIWPLTGDIAVHLNLFRLAGTRGTMVGDAGVSLASERQ